MESERVARPRMLWTNLASAAIWRRIGGLRADRQAAGQRLLGRGQRPQDLILGDVVAGAGLRRSPNESAAPMATIERIAARCFSFQKASYIASPSCAASAVRNNFQQTIAAKSVATVTTL